MEDYELHFQHAERFLEASASARWRSCSQLKSEMQRFSALRLIEHGSLFDKSVAVAISKGDRNAQVIVKRLKEFGAPSECLLLSNSGQLDGQRLSLEEGVKSALDSAFGTLVSCVPGKLGFFSGEFPDDCYILVKKGGSNTG